MTIKKRNIISVLSACVLGFGVASTAPSVSAQENFYEGKTIKVVIRSTPGGGYDDYGRLVARHIGKHIPGNPDTVAVNMPAAGGLVSTNYMYNRAAQDGTEILIPSREFVFAQRAGVPGVRYDANKFNLLGSIESEGRVYLAGPDVPVANLADLEALGETFLFATSGVGAGDYLFMQLLEEGGYDVRGITGFTGSSEANLAVLRGDTHGTNRTFGSAVDVIENEGFKVFAKIGKIPPEYNDTDDLFDFLKGDVLQLAKVMAVPLSVGRPFITGPDVPADRVKILQDAFKAMVEDPELLADAKRAGRGISYTSPEEMRDLYDATLNASDKVMDLVGTN
ncbi:Bug family tripartite tricarboxylate transporter substrate binding protein [Marinobacter sp. BSs20148]|jgi:tripartite-type tricarboxylate transporter receptor subunit TctC|uniref:Bug family tripartite tricarboxylate transporter substrate binding protein n=1 Tax=Marinobacter sp. BSs20148 TaxID=490759 RepID=UPI0002776937|nr:tripartite tricarboxylate transporter substrate-binding protein [Marinobacter sp. BSs20148]AFP30285.1 hypothetical protein MRBBS_1347 [Marinobacter sp. BSs20148]